MYNFPFYLLAHNDPTNFHRVINIELLLSH